MNLLTKTSLNQFWLSLFILMITGFMLLFFLQREVSAEISEQLELQSTMVADEISAGRPINFPLVQVGESDDPKINQSRVFRDTLIYDRIQRKSEGYYYLSSTRQIGGKKYRISVMTSHIGLDGYSKAVGFIFIGMAFLFIFFGSLMNYFVNRKIWQPFLDNLQRLKSYSVSSTDDLVLAQSNISEFKEMNNVLQELSDKSRDEYRALKEFTANASHEIQTPLSIIQSSLESISQSQLRPEQAGYVVDAKQATNRLSRVNKGLLLLAKLENNDFPDRRLVDLKELLTTQLDIADDLLTYKGLHLRNNIGEKQVHSSPFLLEILITNLLSNILAYSPQKGNVTISLDEDRLIFANEGQPLNFPESKLFSRFGKGDDNYKGNGLGLSIVKQICLVNNWEVNYSYSGGMHIFEVVF